jgi:MFS family permease
MGFEMLGSRYLYPHFGGGIGTWAGLISTILLALAIGYFTGGALVDRYPSPSIMATAIAVAAAYLAAIPATADQIIEFILNTCGEGPPGILAAASILLLIPMSLLGMFSPVSVRLLVRSTSETGWLVGLMYSVSTVGSVFGTLFTTFVLIPTIGSHGITYLYACVLGVCALGITFTPRAPPDLAMRPAAR